MSKSYESQKTDQKLSLADAINILSGHLTEAIKQAFGAALLNKVETLGLCCKKASSANDLVEIKAALNRYSVAELKQLIHSFAVFFLLRNQAEQCEIIKIKRQRILKESYENPRAESIAEAIKTLSENKAKAKDLGELLDNIDIIPTITAHPTESRRRSVLLKQLKIAQILFKLEQGELGNIQAKELKENLYALVLGLLLTDDVRAKRLSVHDEVENGIFFLAGSILEIVPQISKDITDACKAYFDFDYQPKAVLRYRSWIGGDRDGNPNVTAKITREAIALHRNAVLKYYIEQVRQVRHELSISIRKHELPEALIKSLKKDYLELNLKSAELIDQHQVFEPLREKCDAIKLKLEKTLNNKFIYLEADFLNDLKILEKSLEDAELAMIAKFSTLKKLIWQARAFGFSLADLDLRQHSKVHQSAISEVLNLNNICDDYSKLSEEQKLKQLHSLLDKPLSLSHNLFSQETTEALEVFRLVLELNSAKSSGIGAYVISMTHSVSDMLEPLLLWKIAGAHQPFPLDLVPLFETIEDLQGSYKLLKSIVDDRAYKSHLKERNNFQEIMLGYSDSNKDGGYVPANVLLYEAQLQIAKVCHENSIKFQIFHGRGGSVGRGGGRAGRAILSSPQASHSGKIRFTEQGEVISFRYSMPELGHRHLEQIISAVILSVGTENPSLSRDELDQLTKIAEIARLTYRSLIDADNFWEWYVESTPIKFISSLPIASRPVMRAGANLEFENLRAIPWVFSWTQVRYNVPSWYGLGTALKETLKNNPDSLDSLKILYKEKMFFKSLIDNAQQEMARARLVIAGQYDFSKIATFHKLIETEFQKTKEVILLLTEQKELLDNNPIIQKSILERNPYTDALNLIQVTLLERARSSKDENEQNELREAIHMSISALAAAMQTTG